jgi:hypothetical protein
MSSRITNSNANSNDIFDAVTADDPPRSASPGITLAQSGSGGYHAESNEHVKGKVQGDPQAPMIVSSSLSSSDCKVLRS